MLTDRQIQVIQSNWVLVREIQDSAADIFYSKLFDLGPELKLLFPEDMSEQKKKLFQTLGVLVNGLQNIDRLIPVLQNLGKRHVDYQVKEEHYALVGEALLGTLAVGLGAKFDDEAREAWLLLYSVAAKIMTDELKVDVAS